MAIGVVLTVALGIIDHTTGYEVAFSIFYLLPIFIVSWYSGRGQGLIIACLSAAVWLTADLTSGHEYSHVAIPFWNTLIRLGFFVVIVYFATENRALLLREQERARTDPLTSVANSRYFLEILDQEIRRTARYNRPMTLVYLDIDNFKQMNDTRGHGEGDRLLKTLAETIRKRTRSTDIIGRMGGDEFAVLMPETAEREAKAAIDDLRLYLIDRMGEQEWPVSFSIGVLTCYDHACMVNDLIKIADQLMYTAKNSGKNAVRYSVLKADPQQQRTR